MSDHVAGQVVDVQHSSTVTDTTTCIVYMNYMTAGDY